MVVSSRKSPAAHASETKVGTVMAGLDKNQWIVKELPNGLKRWVHHGVGKNIYFVEDNGARPFMVKIDKSVVEVWRFNYKRTEEDKKNNPERVPIYDKLIKSFTDYKKVYVGKSTSGEYEDDFEGNSILIKLEPQKYIYIGWIIYSFTTNDEIHTFVSDMGNSGVSYPYGIGSKNTYFLIEDTFLPNELLSDLLCRSGKCYFDDPYEFFYSYDDKKRNKDFRKMYPMKKRVLVKRLSY